MKAKSIKSILKGKINAWHNSIASPEIQKVARENTIVTGGCIASMLLNEEVNDFDVYFRTKKAAAIIAQYYVERFKPKAQKGISCAIRVQVEEDRVRIVVQSAGIASEKGSDKPYQYFESTANGEATEYVGDLVQDPADIEATYEKYEQCALRTAGPQGDKYRPVFISTNAITLSDQVQLIFRFFGDPDDIHENYDFVHCTNYWTSWDNNLVLRAKALEALLTKELIYVGSKYPVCSIFRLRKFLTRGFTISAGQLLKIIMQTNQLDLLNPTVLRDQLTGVDCAYFMEVMSKLTDKDPEKVDYAYLIEVLDTVM